MGSSGPLLGEAAMTSWPPWRSMATVFEPIRPVPPITTIFMVAPLVDGWRSQDNRRYSNEFEKRVRMPRRKK
jgi:hypothetical protein